MSNFFKRLFSFTNSIRVVLTNLIFWVIILLSLYYITNGENEIQRGETLLIQPEIISDSPGEEELYSLFMPNSETLPRYTLLKDILFAIDYATYDNDIKDIILDLDALSSVGYATLEEIGRALQKFKESGKKVYAFSSFYSQEQYYLASFANEISMDPYGELSIDGISLYRNYWKTLLDRYNVDVNIFRAGEYKSYVEPYLSDSMSLEVKKQNLLWMSSIWSGFLKDIIVNRSMDKNIIDEYFNNRISLLREYDGDFGLFSQSEGFVDNLETPTQFYNKFNSFYNIIDYVAENTPLTGKNKVGILNLEGTITYSDDSPGSISAIEVETILDDFINSDSDGLLVRINSGGGGVFASEVIRRKIAEIAEYIPVVVSMGDVCASGGYWIATAGDIIYSDNRTITGSIGVFGMVLGFEDTLEEQLGINNDGVSTTPYADNFSITKNISKESGEMFQLSVDNTYSKFLNIVSESRNLDMKVLEGLAGGRVWSGAQAIDFGLADNLGGLSEAKKYFAEGFKSDDIEYISLDGELSIFDQIYTGITNIASLPSLNVIEEVKLFDRINDPKNIYAIWH